MKSVVNHIQLNIDYSNIDFYKTFFTKIGWRAIGEWENISGYKTESGASIWFSHFSNNAVNNRDAVGLNHIGIGVDSIEAVDQMGEYLKTQKIKLLYDTPKHRPDFADDEKSTYYQIMFDSPDQILFEIMYSGAK